MCKMGIKEVEIQRKRETDESELQNCMEQLEAAESDRQKQALLEKASKQVWKTLTAFAGLSFQTCKGLDFTYEIRGNEMFVSRKGKSITRATVEIAFRKAVEVQKQEGAVTGPKKLGTFGASYLYPIFLQLKIIRRFPVK